MEPYLTASLRNNIIACKETLDIYIIQEVQPKFTQTLPVCLRRVVFWTYATLLLLPFMQSLTQIRPPSQFLYTLCRENNLGKIKIIHIFIFQSQMTKVINRSLLHTIYAEKY
jgi:hypothetical protein